MAEETKSYRVNDRRRFDEDGNEREAVTDSGSTESSAQTRAATANSATVGVTSTSVDSTGARVAQPKSIAASDAPQTDFVMKESGASDSEAAGGGMLSFSSFLMSLATQALIQMGEMEPPGGLRLPPDFEAAKQTIEIIGMLAIKTKGNLDAEEQRLLAEVLHSVRLAFVQRVKLAMNSAQMNSAQMNSGNMNPGVGTPTTGAARRPPAK